MPRDIIIDPNLVITAGFNSRSASARMLQQVEPGRLRMTWVPETRREIEHAVGKTPDLSGRTHRALFREDGCFQGKTYPVRIEYVCDPADRTSAAFADASGATLINDATFSKGGKKRKRPFSPQANSAIGKSAEHGFEKQEPLAMLVPGSGVLHHATIYERGQGPEHMLNETPSAW